jgi:hypothetical protein
MKFIHHALFILLSLSTSLLAFVSEGDFLIKKEYIFIPADLIKLEFNPNYQFFFRVKNGDMFEILDAAHVGDLALQEIQIAIKKRTEICALSFTLKVKANFDSYLKNKVSSREAWGAAAAGEGMANDVRKTKFALHHSEGSPHASAQTVRNIQHYHMHDKKWPDVGYHFLVGRDGTCFEGRKLAFRGAHVEHHNTGNIGICFLGSFESTENNDIETTDAMINKSAELIKILAAHFGIQISRKTLKGHKEHDGARTLCPGDGVMMRLAEIIALCQK